jgi:hypothetical protein
VGALQSRFGSWAVNPRLTGKNEQRDNGHDVRHQIEQDYVKDYDQEEDEEHEQD